jgi:quercetin dioxygenase-like cupin family protein
MKERTENRPQALNTLVDYQEGSVVSRSLLSKTPGNVTLFAFDQGQRLSEHTTPFDALAIAIEGELTITIAEDRHTMKPGESILMPAHIPHAVYATTRCKMMLIMIRG